MHSTWDNETCLPHRTGNQILLRAFECLASARISIFLGLTALAVFHTAAAADDKASGMPTKTAGTVVQPPASESLIDAAADPAFVQKVIELTNRKRQEAGLPPLMRQKQLTTAAMWLAKDMQEKDYLDHEDSLKRDLSQRLTKFEYSGFRTIGENISRGQQTPEEVVATWMESPGHRANILSPEFTEIGVGYVAAAEKKGATRWVQAFGARFNNYPVIINMGSVKIKTPEVSVYVHAQNWAEEMRFSNDAVQWSEWKRFAPQSRWVLEARPGIRTLYVEIRRNTRVKRLEAAVQLAP